MEITASGALERRKYIYEKLTNEGRVTLDELKIQGSLSQFSVAAQSIKDDIEHLSYILGIRIEKLSEGRGYTLLNLSQPTATAKEARWRHQSNEKYAIAFIAASLATAGKHLELTANDDGDEQFIATNIFQEKALDALKSLLSKLDGEFDSEEYQKIREEIETSWSTVNEIKKDRDTPKRHKTMEAKLHPAFRQHDYLEPSNLLEKIASQLSGSNKTSLIFRLQQIWQNNTRRICLDTGTTMDAIADLISTIELPSRYSSLNYLEVITNSRSIFSNLGRPSVKSHCIITGGSQHPRTEALSGPLAESFFDYFKMGMSLSFIGTTVVDLERRVVGSDHRPDGIMKSKMLERGSVRCVVADHQKFMTSAFKGYYDFADLSNSNIDIVITNEPTHEIKGAPTIKEIQGILNKSGIALLAAPQDLVTSIEAEIQTR